MSTETFSTETDRPATGSSEQGLLVAVLVMVVLGVVGMFLISS